MKPCFLFKKRISRSFLVWVAGGVGIGGGKGAGARERPLQNARAFSRSLFNQNPLPTRATHKAARALHDPRLLQQTAALNKHASVCGKKDTTPSERTAAIAAPARPLLSSCRSSPSPTSPLPTHSNGRPAPGRRVGHGPPLGAPQAQGPGKGRPRPGRRARPPRQVARAPRVFAAPRDDGLGGAAVAQLAPAHAGWVGNRRSARGGQDVAQLDVRHRHARARPHGHQAPRAPLPWRRRRRRGGGRQRRHDGRRRRRGGGRARGRQEEEDGGQEQGGEKGQEEGQDDEGDDQGVSGRGGDGSGAERPDKSGGQRTTTHIEHQRFL